MADLAERIQAQGGNVNRILSDAHADAGDVHQLNCTYYSALGADDERYVAARAIQLFARGVPQIYYVGLLAGANDHAAVERTGEGRAINRHDYTADEIRIALDRPVVRRIVDLVRLRNGHPAFDGVLRVDAGVDHSIRLRWDGDGEALALEVDFDEGTAVITDGGRALPVARWAPRLRTEAV